MSLKRRIFTKEFKQQIIREVQANRLPRPRVSMICTRT